MLNASATWIKAMSFMKNRSLYSGCTITLDARRPCLNLKSSPVAAETITSQGRIDCTQWAAVRTHESAMIEPPQVLLLLIDNETAHPQLFVTATSPPTILVTVAGLREQPQASVALHSNVAVNVSRIRTSTTQLNNNALISDKKTGRSDFCCLQQLLFCLLRKAAVVSIRLAVLAGVSVRASFAVCMRRKKKHGKIFVCCQACLSWLTESAIGENRSFHAWLQKQFEYYFQPTVFSVQKETCHAERKLRMTSDRCVRFVWISQS